MKLIVTTALAFVLSAGIASASPCKKSGSNWKCPVNGTVYTVANIDLEVDARAFATAHAAQQQGQGQNQSSDNSNSSSNANTNSSTNTNDNTSYATNGGNSVNIEGGPRHTTSLSANIGLSVSLPLASGIQTRNAIETATWLMQNGQSCVALAVMARAPRVRNLKVNFNCGDKG